MPSEVASSRTAAAQAAGAARAAKGAPVKYEPGMCEEAGKASLKCIEENNFDRAAAAVACAPFYQAYKECKTKMTELRREANRRSMQG